MTASEFRGLEDNHVKFLHHLFSNHTVTHPHAIELIKILLSVAPSASPLERCYSKLSKICYKDRNASKSVNKGSAVHSAINNRDIDLDAILTHLQK